MATYPFSERRENILVDGVLVNDDASLAFGFPYLFFRLRFLGCPVTGTTVYSSGTSSKPYSLSKIFFIPTSSTSTARAGNNSTIPGRVFTSANNPCNVRHRSFSISVSVSNCRKILHEYTTPCTIADQCTNFHSIFTRSPQISASTMCLPG